MKTLIAACNAAELLRDLAIVAACLCYVIPAPAEVDSSTSSRPGIVSLHLGDQSFTFAPNVARAVAEGMIESANDAEGVEL